MKFSVLISVYYKEKPEYLQRSLESIWNDQSLKPSEIVLVKDGSLNCDLENVISDFERIAPLKIVGLELNVGLGQALNIGIKHCSNEYIARMDSDDIAFPNRFEKQLNFLREHPEIDILGTWVDEFENSISNVISQRIVPFEHEQIIEFLKNRSPLNHPTVVYKKKSVIKAGNYQPFHLNEDYYLWGRMAADGCKFHNLKESLLFFRTGSEMFKRRGGIRYAIQDYKLQKEFKKLGLVNLREAIFNCGIRCTSRMLPSYIRGFLYKSLLRN